MKNETLLLLAALVAGGYFLLRAQRAQAAQRLPPIVNLTTVQEQDVSPAEAFLGQLGGGIGQGIGDFVGSIGEGLGKLISGTTDE